MDLAATAINRLQFLSSEEKVTLYHAAPTISSLRKITHYDLQHILQRAIHSKHWSIDIMLRYAEQDMRYFEKQNITVLRYDRLPPLLRLIPQQPFLIYARGVIPATSDQWIAVVGTRRPSPDGERAAYDIGRSLGRAKVPLVSGLALGVDSIVHRAALEEQGICVAVLGNGIDRIYPSRNRSLAHAILQQGGAIISEYPPGILPKKYQFPARNRIISGLACSVLVVEAPVRSGALITARFAQEQNRLLYVLSQCVTGETGAGSAKLAENGATVVSSYLDIYNDLAHKGIIISRSDIASSKKENRASSSDDPATPADAIVSRLEAELNL